MKKCKKWFAVIVAGAMMVGIMTGCSVDEKTAEIDNDCVRAYSGLNWRWI